MLESDILTVTEAGIRVQEKSLRSIGIYNGSVCWGVWYRKLGQVDDSFRHLIISAIHPRSWPFLVHIRVRLKNQPGALEKVCRFIAEEHLSILLAQCTPSGFDNAQLSIIAESTHKNLREWKLYKDGYDRRNPFVRSSGNAYEDARRMGSTIAVQVLAHLQEVKLHISEQLEELPIDCWEEYVPKQDSSAREPADPSRMKPPFDVTSILERLATRRNLFTTEAEARQLIQDQIRAGWSIHYMHRLARFSIFGGGNDVPFALEFDARESLLRPERPGVLQSSNTPFWPKPPFPAVVQFNTRDKYLRVDPAVPRDPLNKLTHITVDYAIASPKQTRPAEDSRGLLWRICQAFQETPNAPSGTALPEKTGSDLPTPPRYLVDIRDMSVKWTYHGNLDRSGRITLVGDCRQEHYGEVRAHLQALNYCHDAQRPKASIKHVDIHQFSVAKLFLSLHFGHPRESDVLRMLVSIARENGLDASSVRTYVDLATGRVLESLQGSRAFMQLLSFRPEEDPESVSLSWLDFEYGVACGLGLPTMRLVDVVSRPYDWWRQKISTNPDQMVKTFRSDASEADLRGVLREAMSELASKVAVT
jgi:hypothetical protein